MEKLRAIGHDTAQVHSKSWHEFTGPDAPRMDFLITLCDTPRGQECPDFGEMAVTTARPLPRPGKIHRRPSDVNVTMPLRWILWRAAWRPRAVFRGFWVRLRAVWGRVGGEPNSLG
jgi:hypothetical protein